MVVWQPGVDPQQVAGLASTRTYPLRSSFRPGYNMAVNLVGRLGVAAARELLEQSFGQFQADRSVVGLARRIERNAETLAGYAGSMRCHLGDFAEYVALRRRVGEREKALRRQGMAQQRDATTDALRALRPGDVIAVPGGRRAGLAVVLDPGVNDGDDPRPLVLTEDRWAGRLSAADFPTPVTALGRMRLPRNVNHRAPRRAPRPGVVAAQHRHRRPDEPAARPLGQGRTGRRPGARHAAPGAARAPLPRLRRPGGARPVGRAARPAGTRDRAAAAEGPGHHALAGAAVRPDPRPAGRARLPLRDDEGETVTPQGERLARLWGESDLLTAECLRHGIWDGLEPAELAAVVSALVYESRRDLGPVPRVPSGLVSEALTATVRLWTGLEADERRHRVDRTREPDLGFAWPMHRWARGESLSAVLTAAEQNGAELSAGDFVRWCRQVLDLLDQVARGRRARRPGREGGCGGGEVGAARGGGGGHRLVPFTAVSRPDRLRRAARVCLDRAGSADEEGVPMTRPYEPEPYGRRPPDPAPDPTAGWGRPPAGGWGGPEPAAGGAVPGPYGDEPQYGWQPQYEPSWGQDYPTKPRRSAQQRGRQRLLVAVVAALVVVVVLVLGFVTPGWFVTRVFDAAAVQTGVTKILTDDYATDGVADVRCPQNVQVTAGATFSCDATIDGDPVTVPITVTDDRGGYQVGRPA